MNEEYVNILEELSKKESTTLALNLMEITADNVIKDKEIERLNNIINELEKWLESEIKRIAELQNPVKYKIKPYGEEYNNYTLIIGSYNEVIFKIEELKEE